MKKQIYYAAILPLAKKLRQNWRAEAAHLPAPARLAAFTLIELSIVLVIIGLIVGGALVGQDLIEATKYRNLISQKEQVVAAVNTFRLKYDALPGDMNNATTFWGTDPNGCPTPGSTSHTTSNNTPKVETCNGDGDKQIYPSSSGGPWNDRNERFRFWQHLANAGLIEGQYTGTNTVAPDASGTSGFFPGLNSLETAFSEIYIDVSYFIPVGTTTSVWASLNGHTLSYIHNTKGGASFVTPIISPNNLRLLDQKTDDGKPATGSMQSFYNISNSSNCVTSNDPNTAEYKSSDLKECSFVFMNLF